METIAVERSIWINTPRQHVWKAITSSEEIQQGWGGDDQWEISALKAGGSIK